MLTRCGQGVPDPKPEVHGRRAPGDSNLHGGGTVRRDCERVVSHDRRVLGQVNLHNVREYPDKDVVAWFYPTAEDGSAAAVWFQPAKDGGALEVYQIKFKAIDPSQMAEE